MDRKEKDLQLDRQIAERIMGLKVDHDLPHYSTNMEEAMKVWDKIRNEGARWLLNVDEKGFHLRHVACITYHLQIEEKDYRVDRPLGTAKKIEDLPRVICQAALKEQEDALKDWVAQGIALESQGHDPGTIGRPK